MATEAVESLAPSAPEPLETAPCEPSRPRTFELRSPRLVLRAARHEDAVGLHKAFSDPEVMRYWSTLPHESLSDTERWVDGMVEDACNGVTDFIVCLRGPHHQPDQNGDSAGIRLDASESRNQQDEQPEQQQQQHQPQEEELLPIGKAGVWRDHEIGFLLARPYWGRGLAAEALRLVLDHLFAGHGDVGKGQVVVADVDPRNAASLALLRKLGFEEYEFRERTFQIGGQWVDSTYLRLWGNTWGRARRDSGWCEGAMSAVD